MTKSGITKEVIPRLPALAQFAVGRQGGEAMILHGAADGEVIQGLKPRVGIPPQHAMHGIIEKTADPG